MDFSHYPTPRLDALKKPHAEYGVPDIVYHYKAVPIEQQLEACRRFIRDAIDYSHIEEMHKPAAEELLTATTPTL